MKQKCDSNNREKDRKLTKQDERFKSILKIIKKSKSSRNIKCNICSITFHSNINIKCYIRYLNGFFMRLIQNGCKLVEPREWFVMRSYTVKFESTHVYKIILKLTKYTYF